jgi:hypothetical protein
MNQAAKLIAILVLYCFGPGINFGQSLSIVDSDKSMPQKELPLEELLSKMATSRESLVQFSVDVSVKGGYSSPYLRNSGNGGKMQNTQFHFEDSTLDKHRIHAARVSTGESWGEWQVGAVSGTCFMGSDRGKLVLRSWPVERPIGGKSGLEFRFFDVKAIGLGSYGDFLKGSTFEELIGNLVENKALEGKSVYDEESSVYRFEEKDSGIRFSISPSKGYWPTEFVFAPVGTGTESTWSVSVEEVEGEFLPKLAVLKYEDKHKKIVNSLEFAFTWNAVNQDFAVGIPAAKRLADSLGLSVDSSRIDATPVSISK